MNYKDYIATFLCLLLLACSPTKQSTIDTTLQTKVDSILQNKMSEIGAISGQAIVMEVNKDDKGCAIGFILIIIVLGIIVAIANA